MKTFNSYILAGRLFLKFGVDIMTYVTATLGNTNMKEALSYDLE
jgi:hypothetical protein